MKEQYTAPMAEMLEINLNDAVAAGCSMMITRRNIYGTNSFVPFSPITIEYFGENARTETVEYDELLDGEYVRWALYADLSNNDGDRNPNNRYYSSWVANTCFTSL